MFAPWVTTSVPHQVNRTRIAITVTDGILETVDTNAVISVISTNHPPTATADSINRQSTNSIKVLASTLVGNDSDPDGDALTVVGLSDAQPLGASVSLSGGWIIYEPPVGSTNAGSFKYTASDGYGGMASSSVAVTVTVPVAGGGDTSRNAVGIQVTANVVGIKFQGIPNRKYRVEYTEKLNPPNTVWSVLTHTTADSRGRIVAEDIAGTAARFYRTVAE